MSARMAALLEIENLDLYYGDAQAQIGRAHV